MELLHVDFYLISEGEKRKSKGKIESDKCYQTLNRLTRRKYRAYIIISEELYCNGGNDESIDCLSSRRNPVMRFAFLLSIVNRDK